jgi:hypothetical protein
MALQTRKPTGAVPWPLILIEGPEKAGKSYALAALSASPRVGRTLWLDLNEGAADEYGAVPGARYEVIEHDGSWHSIIGQVAEAKAEAERAAKAGEKPVVLGIDSGTAEWDMLKDWASHRARSTDANQKKLRQDPNAEISVSMNFWNDAASRHRKLMTMLMTFPGIVVVTARGKDVAALDEKGSPIAGTKDYRVEGHKNLGFDCSCWIRVYRDRPAIMVGARSVHAGVRPGKDKPKTLPDDWSLEWVIFDALKCDPAKARVRDLTNLQPGELTPDQMRAEALDPWTTVARIRELYVMVGQLGYEEVTVPGEKGDELLPVMLGRTGAARQNARQALPENDPWLEAINGMGLFEDTEKLKREITESFGSMPASDLRLMGIREAYGEKLREIAAQAPARAEPVQEELVTV